MNRFHPRSPFETGVRLTALAALFFFAILTLWIPDHWPIAVFQVGVFALAIIALLRAGPSLFPLPYPLLVLSLAVLWGIVQLLTGHTLYPFATQRAIVQWATYLAVFLAAGLLFTHSDASRQFRLAMLWFGFLVSILATLQTFTADGKVFWLFPSGYTEYVMGPIVSRNHYAAFIEIVLPLALYQSLRSEKSALLYSGMAAVLYASVIASASRAGVVLTTAEIVLVLALMALRRKTSSSRIGAAVLQMVLLFAFFTAVVGWDRVWSRFLQPDPMTVRREYNISSLHMIQAHPWWGTGLGTWPTVYPQYAITDIGTFANQAHNDWAEWTVEGGGPFGLLMATLFLWCIRPALRTIWGIGVLAVFLHACVDYPFSRPALGSWPILLIAMFAFTHSSHASPAGPPASPLDSQPATS